MLEKLKIIKNLQDDLYDKYDLKIENFFPEKESSEYHAHTFSLKNKKGLFRIAKKTPTKIGYFVTIWKRGADNIIAPYEKTDAIDLVIIAVFNNNHIGEFIFPKAILLKQKIFSANNSEGKRAIRVYAPWDKTTSVQAAKTQEWQSQFFVHLDKDSSEFNSTIKNFILFDL